jgi:hypothetical protein
MSHHFDTPTAREDPRINLCDFYLFRGRPGTTVMAMTVNPDAGLSAPNTFRHEGLYAFRFDLNNDANEEVTFKFRFGPESHADDEESRHVQPYEVRRATGESALRGDEGEMIAAGRTGDTVNTPHGVAVYAGLAPELFAGDASALGAFQAAFKDGRFEPAAFQNRKNYFARRNVTAIVLEVPSEMIGRGNLHSWATVSLVGHAPEVQVSRWGLPLITHLFMPDMDMKEEYNRSRPCDDVPRFSAQIGGIVEHLTTLARSTTSPSDYAQNVLTLLCPTILPYQLDTEAAFDFVGFNGRALADDVMDVMLTLTTNTTLGDGVVPDGSRIRSDFPYFGSPYSNEEQIGVIPHGATH